MRDVVERQHRSGRPYFLLVASTRIQCAAVDFVRVSVRSLSPFEDALAGAVASDMARDPGLHLPRTLSTSALRIKTRCSFWEKMNELPTRKLTARFAKLVNIYLSF